MTHRSGDSYNRLGTAVSQFEILLLGVSVWLICPELSLLEFLKRRAKHFKLTLNKS